MWTGTSTSVPRGKLGRNGERQGKFTPVHPKGGKGVDNQCESIQ